MTKKQDHITLGNIEWKALSKAIIETEEQHYWLVKTWEELQNTQSYVERHSSQDTYCADCKNIKTICICI